MAATDARAGDTEGRARSTAMYLYGVVRAGSVSRIDADAVFGGGVVSLIESNGLAALTSEVPDGDLRVRRRDLRRHLDVLEEAFEETTVLPCRFGTAVGSADDVRSFLSERAAELSLGLDRLENCVQLNLKVSYDEEELLREIVARDPDIATLSAATRGGGAASGPQMRLGEMVAAAIEIERERDAATIVESIRPYVIELTDADAGADAALKTSLLVRRSELPRLESELEALAERERRRLRFELIGPLPPTAFASAAIEV